jgi:tetratricopeptide (TPR) repeat protein
MGAFSKAVAIDTYKDRIFVLDSEKGSVTYFDPTEYGALIRKAVTLYNDGQYENALDPWKKVLALNSNYELAYTGIAQAFYKTGNYAEAISYYKKGFSPKSESEAFKKLRSQVMSDNFQIVIIVSLLLLIAAVAFTNKKFYVKVRNYIRRKAG